MNEAGTFVKAALMEAGFPHLAPGIYTNKRGHPAWRASSIGDMPKYEEVDAVMKAFDLWYRHHPVSDPDMTWLPYSNAKVQEVYEIIGKFYARG